MEGANAAKVGHMQRDLQKIVDFAEYWLSKSADGRLPCFGDLLPEEMFRALPNLVVWEVLDGGEDFRCRLCGEDLNRNYGWNPTGQRLNAIAEENPSIAVFGNNFRLCLTQARPITVIDNFRGHQGTVKRTIGVIAPLAGPAGEISDLVCCSLYITNGELGEADRQLSALFQRIESRL